MEFIFSQICGIIVSVAAIISMQLKNIKTVLLCQLICNGVGALSYILVGGLSGCGIYIVALLQSIIFFIYRAKGKKAPLPLTYIFVALFLTCSILAYRAPQDIISAIASMTCALALVQEKPSVYRIFMLANGIIWMLYDVSVYAYTMILSHVITAVSALTGIIRLDIKKKSQEQ